MNAGAVGMAAPALAVGVVIEAPPLKTDTAPEHVPEGVSGSNGELHPMRQILSAIACVREGNAGDAAQVREYMSGNLCRCADYPHIVDAKAKMDAD